MKKLFNKWFLFSNLILTAAITIGLSNTIIRNIDPTIPINKTTNTTGLILFIGYMVFVATFNDKIMNKNKDKE